RRAGPGRAGTRREAERPVPVLRRARGPRGPPIRGARAPGRRSRRARLSAPRLAALHPARPPGPERGRRVPGGVGARRAHPGLVRRRGAGPHPGGLPRREQQGRVLCREPVRERVAVLRRHLGAQPRGGRGLGQAEGRHARLGAPRVVAPPEPDDGGGGRARAVAVRAPPRHPARRRMNTFHPHLLDRRLRAARVVVWSAVGVLLAAFFRTQILEHARFRLQSETNRLRPIPLPAPRGIITDRNGKVLAENVPGYTVALLPGDEDSLRARLARLAPLLRLDSAAVERVLARYRRAPYLPVTVVPNASFALVSALPGLLIQPEPRRFYPDSEAVAHLVGYVGEVTETERAQRRLRLGGLVGKDGLEREYDDTLRGADGVRFVEVSALGQVVRDAGAAATLRPVPGHALHTTIDLDLQRYVAQIFP